MTHASLFSGIGGFDLAAEWMGWENIFHCEWNPFGQRVLAHHFPNSKSYNDITKTDFTLHAGQVDILTGGFPCQPYSSAGKRLGKADERHLFPHMLRCVKEIKPKWVVGENVRGLVNWNGGLVFHEVQDDLEREGYEVQSFLIPAAGVNAPHQRYRVWFVAYCNNEERFRKVNNNREWSFEKQKPYDRNKLWNNIGSTFESGNVTDTYNNGYTINKGKTTKKNGISEINRKEVCSREFNGTSSIQWNDANTDTSRLYEQHTATKSNKKDKFSRTSFEARDFSTFPTKSPVCGGDDGIPRELDAITFSKWRNESIKAYGNAIVPQVAYEIFKAIQSFEDMVNV